MIEVKITKEIDNILSILAFIEVDQILGNPELLVILQNLGIVELHKDTSKEILGIFNNPCWCYYVDSCKPFKLGDYYFAERYLDGCFYPFVTRTK